MKDLLDQIELALRARIYAPALISAMMIPDAGGAVEFEQRQDGQRRPNGERYTLWFDKWVAPQGIQPPSVTGKVLWKVRNAMLHETSLNLQDEGISRITFTLPVAANIVVTVVQTDSGGLPGTVISMHMPDFCRAMVAGARNWIASIANDEKQSGKLDKLLQYRAFGMQGHIVGLPMFG